MSRPRFRLRHLLEFTRCSQCHHTTHRRMVAKHSITVWVNTRTGIYHYSGQRWYGNTEYGEYMSEEKAKSMGYRATENGQ